LLAIGGSLPRSRSIGSAESAYRDPLKAARRAALYWDAWVDDARLTVLNAVDAAERGAEIATHTVFLSAVPIGGRWKAELGGGRTVLAGTIVNAAGPWVAEVLNGRLRRNGPERARLVKGSHIVVPRLHDGEHAYILQQPDGRVVFALPYGRHTLIGTTDISVDAPDDAAITPAEIDYLCAAANRYFVRETRPEDVVWSYSGIRSLHDDGAESAQAVTRDYHLELDDSAGARLLSVFGGKITTARALAEEALDRLGVTSGRKVTATSALPGGDIGPDYLGYLERLGAWMPAPLLLRLSRAYGTRLREMTGEATSLRGLGRHFGAGLYEAEVRYLHAREFARTAEDMMWRRTKLGLDLSVGERERLAAWISRLNASSASA
jgi:glycerol-3-phosphate dehydrogenase